MNRKATRWFTLTAVLALALTASAASAFTLRAPQVPVSPPSLQNYLNGVGESINVNTDQLDAQIWTSSVSGNTTLTLMLELAGFANQNAIGVYNVDDPVPTLFQIFPGAASPGWYAVASFQAGGNLVVSLFDNNSLFQGQTTYAGVNGQKFGYYLQGPAGTFFSQDYRNGGGAAQALTYAGTGRNFGDWWLCWEDTPGGDRDFDDAVLLLQSVVPTPAGAKTWGSLKSLYAR